MKKKSASQSAFLNLRLLTGAFLVLTGVFLALIGIGRFSVQAQSKNNAATTSINPLVPAGFDCAQLRRAWHQRARKPSGWSHHDFLRRPWEAQRTLRAQLPRLSRRLLAPLLGGTDVDLITGAETSPILPSRRHSLRLIPITLTKSSSPTTTHEASLPTPLTSPARRSPRTAAPPSPASPAATGQSPFSNTFGDPVVLYNSPTGTWFTVWLDVGCGGQGLGGYKSTTPSNPDSWTHFCVHTGSTDDRESGWADNNPSSPFFGRMYVSWNNFADGGSLQSPLLHRQRIDLEQRATAGPRQPIHPRCPDHWRRATAPCTSPA